MAPFLKAGPSGHRWAGICHLRYEWDIARGVIAWDGDARQVLGVEMADLGQDANRWLSFIEMADRANFFPGGTPIVPEERNSLLLEYRVRRPGHGLAILQDMGTFEFDAQGSAILKRGYLYDVSERTQVMSNVANKRRWLEYVLDLMPAPFILIDTHKKRVIFSNTAADKLVGGRFPRELLGSTERRDLYFTDREKQILLGEKSPLARVAHGERLQNFEVVLHRESEKIPLLISSGNLPPVFEQNEAEAVVFQDVNLLHKAEDRLNTALETARMARWEVCLQSGNILRSEKHDEMFGYSPKLPFWNYERFYSSIHPEDRKIFDEELWRPILRGENASAEYRIVLPDGGIRWLRSSGQFHAEKDSRGRVAGVTMDVTDIKERVNELAQSNTELKHFTHVVSHDLIEPLRMILSFSELLKRTYVDKLDETARKYLNHTIDGAKRMSHLIDDLKSFTISRATVKAHQPVDMALVVRAALDNLQISIEQTRVEIAIGELPVIQGNFIQLTQVFQNLISNAIKFRSANAPLIRISSEKSDTHWLFRVADNGIGISPEHHERIFELFTRVHATPDHPGTGLGLAICKQIIESHGGRIWVDSLPASGACFVFTLRLSENDRVF